MKGKLLLALVSATFAYAAPALADPAFLLDFSGSGYRLALPTSTHLLDVGDGYSSVGYVTSVDPTLLGDHVDTGDLLPSSDTNGVSIPPS